MDAPGNDPACKQQLHPAVLRVIEALRAPSPCAGPSDPEQPKHGSLLDLRARRVALNRSESLSVKRQEILARTRLNNQSLLPATVGWTGHLECPCESLLLKRRKIVWKNEQP